MQNLNLRTRLPTVLNKKSNLQKADAAVSLILTPIVEDYEILFVKRVERASDPWSGQIAFPGGKIETSDKTLEDTVIREVYEETNIKVEEKNILGVLEIIRSETQRNIKILPFIAILEKKPHIKLNKNELDRFFWIPYKKIENSRGITKVGFRKIPAYIFGEDIIWGVTYNILSAFNKIIESLKNC